MTYSCNHFLTSCTYSIPYNIWISRIVSIGWVNDSICVYIICLRSIRAKRQTKVWSAHSHHIDRAKVVSLRYNVIWTLQIGIWFAQSRVTSDSLVFVLVFITLYLTTNHANAKIKCLLKVNDLHSVKLDWIIPCTFNAVQWRQLV